MGHSDQTGKQPQINVPVIWAYIVRKEEQRPGRKDEFWRLPSELHVTHERISRVRSMVIEAPSK